jgi:3-oxoacyl-[acyl-carrier-protein] synthase I
MREVFVASDNIISPLGLTTTENFDNMLAGKSGVSEHANEKISDHPFFASLFDDERFNSDGEQYTRFEQLLISSITDALGRTQVRPDDLATVIIISSTKGNIHLLGSEPASPELNAKISLTTSAQKVGKYFNYHSQPVVISNACISSLVALLTAKRLIESGRYENAIVAGADVISKFILSGFESFQALSDGVCKPFDAGRNGINLGEAAATMVLTSNRNLAKHGVKLSGGAVSNDANHISGPSTTGEELGLAIKRALDEAKIFPGAIDFISAHGTATVYNDEMESKAIGLSGLQDVPVNSLKGYFGHTLGAAGLVESIIAIQSMKEGIILPTLGLKNTGVNLRVSNLLQKQKMKNILKTASGFGGCNAALVFNM